MKNCMTIITSIITEGRTGFGEAIVSAIEKLEGKRARIAIEEYKKPRSNRQNRYYWGVVLRMYVQYFQRQGVFMSNDDMHIWIKEYVWSDFVDVIVNDVPFRKILTSTRLTTMEWEERMTLARAYASEHFSLNIPEPSERIDEHVQEWLEHPDGVYYDADYTNYFSIEKPVIAQ